MVPIAIFSLLYAHHISHTYRDQNDPICTVDLRPYEKPCANPSGVPSPMGPMSVPSAIPLGYPWLILLELIWSIFPRGDPSWIQSTC